MLSLKADTININTKETETKHCNWYSEVVFTFASLLLVSLLIFLSPYLQVLERWLDHYTAFCTDRTKPRRYAVFSKVRNRIKRNDLFIAKRA
jgi:hypothetical protein